jgi:transcriptional regulator with XRE-family HTH domain
MVKTLTQTVGEKVRQYRKIKGLSQEELAALVGVSAETVGNIERAKHAPSLATLEKILAALEVTASSFFNE